MAFGVRQLDTLRAKGLPPAKVLHAAKRPRPSRPSFVSWSVGVVGLVALMRCAPTRVKGRAGTCSVNVKR